jgi:Protein of unknown function (DUF664)
VRHALAARMRAALDALNDQFERRFDGRGPSSGNWLRCPVALIDGTVSIVPGAVGAWGQAIRPCPAQVRRGPSPLPAGAREALLWKLDGLSEYDTRRLLTSTAIDLVGPVKHVPALSWETSATPFDEPLPWFEDDAEPNPDMWATAEHDRRD